MFTRTVLLRQFNTLTLKFKFIRAVLSSPLVTNLGNRQDTFTVLRLRTTLDTPTVH
jgi:hypothetical protein